MDDARKVFSPGGGGSRNTITFRPTGSFEDAWESGIYNMAGDKVRSFENESGNPGPRVWDGRNDSGVVAGDGVYTYRISVTDRAQNSASASLENIIVNTVRPVVNVVITDPWFNPAGVKNTVGMDLSVPAKNEVTGWTMQIKDREGSLRRTISGGQAGGPGSAWTATGIVSVPER
jgi:flagellar hook assembly protein FlgD